MFTGRKSLQQKHPEVRHEVLSDTVIGVIQQDFHRRAGLKRQPSAGAFLSPASHPQVSGRKKVVRAVRRGTNVGRAMVSLKRPSVRRSHRGTIGGGFTWPTSSTTKYRSEERRVGKECRSRRSPYH